MRKPPPPRPTKHTKDILAAAVARNKTASGVARDLGVNLAMVTYLRKRFKFFGIDTSHFCGRGHNESGIPKSWDMRTKPEGILRLRDPSMHPEATHRLRRALLEIGRKHECEKCEAQPFWMGEPLVLQIDHKNGLKHDNRPENLAFLCPNCHSQTPTYGIRNRKAVRK